MKTDPARSARFIVLFGKSCNVCLVTVGAGGNMLLRQMHHQPANQMPTDARHVFKQTQDKLQPTVDSTITRCFSANSLDNVWAATFKRFNFQIMIMELGYGSVKRGLDLIHGKQALN